MSDDIRTLVHVALVIKPPGGAERHIVAQIDRLPHSHPDDPGRGLETFRLSIQEDDKLEQEKWVLPSLRFAKDRLTRQLHELLNMVDYGSKKTALEVVEITDDRHGLLEHHFCRCQDCGSKFLEHFGYLGAAIKKCKCGRLTVCSHATGRSRQV